MSRFHTLTAALLASTALVGAAQADVTAQQVWDTYRTMLTLADDATLTVAEETTEGNALVLRGITVATDVTTQRPYSDRTERNYSTTSYDEMRFADNGDGTVTVSMIGETRATFGFEGGYGDRFEVELVSTYDNYTDLVSGTPERMEHVLAFDSSSAVIERIDAGEDLEMTVPIAFTTGAGGGSMTHEITDEAFDVEGEMHMESLRGTGMVNASADERFGFVLSAADMATTFNMVMPMELMQNPDDMDAFPEDLVVAMSLDTGPMNLAVDVATPYDGTMSFALTSGGEHLTFDMSADGLVYEQDSQDLRIGLQSTELPFPVSITADQIGSALTFPLAASDEPRDMRMALFLDTVAVNEEIWQLVDFANVLPHDPVTIRADISGLANVLMDLTSDEAMMMDMPPVEPVSVSIDELVVQGAGLNATGEGAFEFDLTDTESYDGVPAPIGKLSLDIEGLNGLLDNLVAMGLLPEDEVTMGRMMLGAFTVPTGDDALSTELELREGGQIFANGQRLK